MAWSPDGSKFAATVFSSNTEAQSTRLVVWNTSDWEIVLELYNAVNSIVFSPDNRYIATQAGYNITIYDLDAEIVVNQFQLFSPSSIKWNPTNLDEMVVGRSSSNPNSVVIVNPFTGYIIHELSYSYIFFPSYSPNGQFLAVGRFDDNGVRIVDILDTTDNYHVVASLPHENGLFEDVESIYWLGNDEIGTSSFLGEAFRWDTVTGERTVLPVLEEWTQAYWKPDGSMFIASDYDSTNTQLGLLVYDGYTGEVIAHYFPDD